MRYLYEKLKAMVREFVEQRDDLLLLVATGDGEGALLLKALRDFDHSSPGDLVLLFGQPFAVPVPYLDTIAAALRDEVEMVNAGAVPQDTPLPLPPEAMFEPAVPPATRLKFGLSYAASLVDPRGAQHYVWGMVPAEIRDARGYAQLLANLPSTEPQDWMRGGRVIARVPADFDLPKSPLAGAPRVRFERFEIPHDAHEQELLATLNDSTIPEADRMGAAVQLGYIDAAHNRLPQATAHFRKSLAFFQWVRLPAMEGLVMMGLGDVARRQGDLVGARRWFESALVPAAQSENPVLLASIVQHLAAINYEQKAYAEAAEQYGQLVELRRATFDEVGVAEALEWQGNARDKAGQTQQAVFAWYEAALVGKTFKLEDRLKSVLPSLRRGYEKLEWKEPVETFEELWGPQGAVT